MLLQHGMLLVPGSLARSGLVSAGLAMDRPFPIVTMSFAAVLLVLLAVDLGFVLLDAGAFFAVQASLISAIPDEIKITVDGALPEVWGYVKWMIIIAALIRLSIRDRWSVPLRWALVFLMVLIDDSLQEHETIGSLIAGKLPLPASLQSQGQDIAEVLVFGVMGLIAVLLTATLFTRNGPIARALSLRFLLIILFLAFFGVALDFLHQTIRLVTEDTFAAGFLPPIFGLLEDGGEMVVASIATAFVLTLPGIEALSRKPEAASG